MMFSLNLLMFLDHHGESVFRKLYNFFFDKRSPRNYVVSLECAESIPKCAELNS